MSATSAATSSTNAEAGSRKRQKRAEATPPRVARTNLLSEAVASLLTLLPRFAALGAAASAPSSLAGIANNAAYHVVHAHEILGRSADMASAAGFQRSGQGFKQCCLSMGESLTRIGACSFASNGELGEAALQSLHNARDVMTKAIGATGCTDAVTVAAGNVLGLYQDFVAWGAVDTSGDTEDIGTSGDLEDTGNGAARLVVRAWEHVIGSKHTTSATWDDTSESFDNCCLAIGDTLTGIVVRCIECGAVRADQAVTCLKRAFTMIKNAVSRSGGLLGGGDDDDDDGDDGDEAFDKETDNDDDDEGGGSDGAAVAAAVTPARSSGAFRRLQFGAVPRDDVPMAQLATPELPRDCNNDDDMSMQSVTEGSDDGTSSSGTPALEEEEDEREDMATSTAHSTIDTVLEAWQFVTWFTHTKLHPWNEFMQDGATKPAHKLVPSCPRRVAQLPVTFTHHCVSP